MWHLQTFGGLAIEPGRAAAAVVARRRPLALLALLATAGERGWSREQIIALLWPQSDEEHGRNSLSQALAALRRDLASPDPVLAGHRLRLNPSAVTSDVGEFEGAIASGALACATSLYQGPFLDGFFLRDADDLERWVCGYRRRLHQMQATALEHLAHAADEQFEHELALSCWRRFAELEPTNTLAVSGMMRALATIGDRTGALRHYREHEEAVRQEFGVAPEPAVSDLAASLLSERAAPSAASAMPSIGP
jgi:DNA-binding SARP family transcriptional activator